jgi:threonine dehydratase
VPIGGGGLIAGVAAAIKQVSPRTRVVGVEPEWENDTYLSFRQGRRLALPKPSASVADAVKVQIVGEKTFPLIQQYVDDIILVSEEQIIQAIPFAEQHTGGSVEPAGALAVAAALFGSWSSSAPMDLVAIVSGGNITPERRADLLDGVKV